MSMVRGFLFGAASIAAMSAGAATAAPVVITDNILVRGFTQLAPTGNASYNHFVDNIGDTNTWQTYAIEVETVGANVNFRIYTNKGTDGEGGVAYSDFFIDLEPDNAVTGPFGNWDIGVDFQTGNVYSTANSTHWRTSQQIFAGNGGVIYGGLFRAADCGAADASDGNPAACNTLPDGDPGAGVVRGFEPVTQVVADAGRLLGTAAITFGGPGGNPYGAQHVLSFSLAASMLNGGGGFDVFWGTGECSNDAIWGPVPQTPEPAVLALFGLGLVGAYVGVRRRRSAA